MTWLIILILLIGGLILLILELLVVPGTTVVGIIGFILMAVGIWQSYMLYGAVWGSLILMSTLVLASIGFYLSLQSKTWNKAMLNKSIDSKVNTESQKLHIGEKGRTVSIINPMGKAIFNNEFYEVSSFGDFIETDQDVKIISIDGTKITVALDSTEEKNNKKIIKK